MNPDQPTPAERAAEALRYLSVNPRPCGGESDYNAAHLLQLADELLKPAATIAAHVPPIPTVPGNQWAFYWQDENGLVHALLAIKDDDAYVTTQQDAKWFQRNGHRLVEVVEASTHVPGAEAREEFAEVHAALGVAARALSQAASHISQLAPSHTGKIGQILKGHPYEEHAMDAAIVATEVFVRTEARAFLASTQASNEAHGWRQEAAGIFRDIMRTGGIYDQAVASSRFPSQAALFIETGDRIKTLLSHE